MELFQTTPPRSSTSSVSIRTNNNACTCNWVGSRTLTFLVLDLLLWSSISISISISIILISCAETTTATAFHHPPPSLTIISSRRTLSHCSCSRSRSRSNIHNRRQHNCKQQQPQTLSLLFAQKNNISNNDIQNDIDIGINIDNTDNSLWKERAKRWVVLVDDEESIRLAVGEYLYHQGYQVTACADADALFEVIGGSGSSQHVGTPASHMMEQESVISALEDDYLLSRTSTPLPNTSTQRQRFVIPDIIVSDIRMPGSSKDGIELTQLIRSTDRLRRIPIVLLSAKSMTQDRILGYKAGADAYLTKPFDPAELLSIIDNTIQRRQQMAGAQGKMVDLAQDLSDVKQVLEQQTGQAYTSTKSRNSIKPNQRPHIHLTPKESQVLTLLCEGYTNGEIAIVRQNKSAQSVNRTIQTLYRKTGAQTRTELIRWAIQSGNVAKPK
jgi:DNA-binding NarL/FixJ family response regulator